VEQDEAHHVLIVNVPRGAQLLNCTGSVCSLVERYQIKRHTCE